MAYLIDGYSTTVSFSEGTVMFKEKTVTPPGIDGGDPVDITTMRNTDWRTMSTRKLKSLTNMSFTAVYDPQVLSSILPMVNKNQEITVTHPDGSKWKFWGFLKSFTPNENVEGELPTASVEVVPTNRDASGNEVAPTYIPA